MNKTDSMKQTAVEWLEKELNEKGKLTPVDFFQAKEMEKQQIIDAYRNGIKYSEEYLLENFCDEFQKGYLWNYLSLTNYNVDTTYFEFWRDENFSEIEVELIQQYLFDKKYQIKDNKIIIMK